MSPIGTMAACWCALYLTVAPHAQAKSSGVSNDGALGFSWVDVDRCEKPKVREPRLPVETYEKSNFQRRFIRLIEGRPCFILDVYIHRLGGSASIGMRTRGSDVWSFKNGRWTTSGTSLDYFPYALRRDSDGQVFWIVAIIEEDFGDDTAAGNWSPTVRVKSKWRGFGDDSTDAPGFDFINEPGGEVFQALAVLLNRRLKAGLLTLGAMQNLDTERKRIGLLLKSAWESMPTTERVAIGADGLPR